MSPRKEALFKTAAVVGGGILFFSLPIIFPGQGLTLMLFIMLAAMAGLIVWMIYTGFRHKAEMRQIEKEREERWNSLAAKPKRYGGAK